MKLALSKINKTSEDNVVKDIEFKVTGSDGSSYTEKTNSSGVAANFSGLKVYNSSTGKAITYTVFPKINVASRYENAKGTERDAGKWQCGFNS